MSVVTTYICDVSGVSSNYKKDFVEITVKAVNYDNPYSSGGLQIVRLVHKDVAKKLHLVTMTKVEKETIPEPTIESKLLTLLKDYVTELAYEAGSEGAMSAINNR